VTTVMTVMTAEHKAVITPRVTFGVNILVGVSTMTDVSQEPCDVGPLLTF
jgi:hypothetical protein